MNIDKSSLQNLANMNDDELRMKILQIASACGADTKKLAKKLDTSKLRENISSMSQSDIDRIMKAVGRENAKTIKENIENGGK